MNSNDPQSYSELVDDLKYAMECAQSSAVQAVNRAVIQLFWDIGRSIVQREEFESLEGGWVDSISRDLLAIYPGSTAFSAQNIQRMRRFFLAYTRDYGATAVGPEMNGMNLPDVLTTLPWRHNMLLIEIVKDPAERLWYAQAAMEFGWSREALEHEIRQGRYRQSSMLTAPAVVPSPELAREILADPLTAEFVRLTFR